VIPAQLDEARLLYERLLALVDDDRREGLENTPARAARALADLTSGYDVDLDAMLTTFPAEGSDQMIIVRDVPVYSLCEHHVLPFIGKAHVAYLPSSRIIGLSKIPRIVDAFARRLQVQERLTEQIAAALWDALKPFGVGVVIEAEHLCMTMRGVRTPGAVTTTSVLRGTMRDHHETRAEALRLLLRG